MRKLPSKHESAFYGYFQGSAGGYSTTVTLTRTFVQPNYQENWIKGVQFYYAGKPIQDGDWDHIKLDGVISELPTPPEYRSV